MDGIYELVALLQILIPLGVVPRVIYCLIYTMIDEDQAATYKRRARNAVLFLVTAECAAGIILVIKNYLT